MKKIILLFCLVLAANMNVLAQQAKAEFSFAYTKYRFGFVHQGAQVKFEYEFKNTGDQPLVITNIKVACGCTVVHQPNHPIKKGESSSIKVEYDTSNAIGRQDRTITIYSNAGNSPIVLRFKGVILKPKKKE